MSADDEGGSEGQADIASELDANWIQMESAGSAEPSEPPAPVADDLEAPYHWSQEDKDAFKALPAELRPLYLERTKSLERGYNRKFEELAGLRKEFESVQENFSTLESVWKTLEPYQEHLTAANLAPAEYLNRLFAVSQSLQARPRETLLWLADRYGVDLGQPAGGPSPEELQSHFQNAVTQAVFDNEWRGFESTHPGAEKLRGIMGGYLQTNPLQPGETTRQALQRAYEAIKWSDPAFREAELNAREAEHQRKADLAKAKAVGRTIRPKSAPVIDTRAPKDSWKAELEANWERTL